MSWAKFLGEILAINIRTVPPAAWFSKLRDCVDLCLPVRNVQLAIMRDQDSEALQTDQQLTTDLCLIDEQNCSDEATFPCTTYLRVQFTGSSLLGTDPLVLSPLPRMMRSRLMS